MLLKLFVPLYIRLNLQTLNGANCSLHLCNKYIKLITLDDNPEKGFSINF